MKSLNHGEILNPRLGWTVVDRVHQTVHQAATLSDALRRARGRQRVCDIVETVTLLSLNPADYVPLLDRRVAWTVVDLVHHTVYQTATEREAIAMVEDKHLHLRPRRDSTAHPWPPWHMTAQVEPTAYVLRLAAAPDAQRPPSQDAPGPETPGLRPHLGPPPGLGRPGSHRGRRLPADHPRRGGCARPPDAPGILLQRAAALPRVASGLRGRRNGLPVAGNGA